jgi:hypothetical protein
MESMTPDRRLYLLSCAAVIVVPFLFYFRAAAGVSAAVQKFQVSPLFYDMDCYLWHQTASQSHGRLIHFTNVDNAPCGREVHWATPLYWMICVASRIAALAGARDSLLEGCIIVSPLILAILVALANIIILSTARSLRAAAWFNLAIAGCKYLLVECYPYRPDHHGLFSAVFCLQCLMLVLGLTRGGKSYFCVAGIFAGISCWILLAQAWPLFLLVAVAALIVMRWQPALNENWMAWAISAAVSSVCFYFVEYYPALPMRLEINQPVYAAIILSWAVLLRIFPRFISAVKLRGLDLALACVALLPTVLLTGTLLLGPPSVHALRDPLMFRLHTFIPEFMPPIVDPLSIPFYIVPGFLAVYAVARHRAQWPEKKFSGIMFMAALVLGLTLAALLETRWTGLLQAATVILVVALVLYHDGKTASRPSLIPVRLSIGLLTLLIFCTALEPVLRPAGRVGPLPESVSIYRALKPEMVARPLIILGAMDSAPELYAWSGGRIRSVDSSYWENKAGVHAACDALAALDTATASKIFRDRAVDYIAVQPGRVDYYVALRYGVSDPELDSATTVSRLVRNEFPGAILNATVHARDLRRQWRIYRLQK